MFTEKSITVKKRVASKIFVYSHFYSKKALQHFLQGFYLMYPEPESNRHEIALIGF
jgi:hypothetical protein